MELTKDYIIEAYSLVFQYVTMSYEYYKCDQPSRTDGEYDNVCRQLLNYWEFLKGTDIVKSCEISEELLVSGSGYSLKYSANIIKLLNL